MDPCSLHWVPHFLGVLYRCYFELRVHPFRNRSIKDPQQPLFHAKSGWQRLALHQHIQSPSINHQHSFQYWISTITFRWLILSFFLEVLGSKLVWVSKICKTSKTAQGAKRQTQKCIQYNSSRIFNISCWESHQTFIWIYVVFIRSHIFKENNLHHVLLWTMSSSFWVFHGMIILLAGVDLNFIINY